MLLLFYGPFYWPSFDLEWDLHRLPLLLLFILCNESFRSIRSTDYTMTISFVIGLINSHFPPSNWVAHPLISSSCPPFEVDRYRHTDDYRQASIFVDINRRRLTLCLIYWMARINKYPPPLHVVRSMMICPITTQQASCSPLPLKHCLRMDRC